MSWPVKYDSRDGASIATGLGHSENLMSFIVTKTSLQNVTAFYSHFFRKYSQSAVPLLLLVWSVINRAPTFGNPLVHIDEQFYLFGGGQVLEGDLPYIQFWDRKPVGLFLLYAFFHLFGTYRVLAYQLGAVLSVWGTAWLLFRMALTIAPRAGAMVSAMLYIVWLDLSGGEGGQSPVFYTLPVTGAMALILFRIVLPKEPATSLRTTGTQAMALIGLALQIKYTVVFEGVALGLYLIWSSHINGRTFLQIAADCACWIGAAVLPTVLVAVFYQVIGYGHQWVFANIVSIFLRGHPSPSDLTQMKMKMLRVAAPLLVGLGVASRFILLAPRNRAGVFLAIWVFAACGGVIIMGGWYYHYALPAYAPLAIMSAPLWRYDAGRIWLIVLVLVGVCASQNRLYRHQLQDGNLRTYRAMLNAMKNPAGCVFIYQGPPILYDTPHWCGVTDHPFPGHFNEKVEINATGFDPREAIKRIFLKRPRYIVSKSPAWSGENMEIRKILYQKLDLSYRKIFVFHGHKTDTEIFELKD